MMQFVTTVTQKGQITLPIVFRKQLKIEPYDKVILNLSVAKKAISVKPAEDILDMAGTLVPRANKHISPLQARQMMEKNYQRT